MTRLISENEVLQLHKAALLALSPWARQDEIQAKVRDYLEAGVKLVWVIDPMFRTVVVYRPDHHPEMFAGEEELTGEPHLPGFRCNVAKLFEA